MPLSSSKMFLRFRRNKKGRCFCGLISIQTGIFIVSLAALLTDAGICFLSMFPRWIDGNFELLRPNRVSFLNPRVIGAVVSMFGMLTSILLCMGNRYNDQYFYILFLIAAGMLIVYAYYAAFVFLFRALLLVEEKGSIRASKRYIEAGALIVSSVLNVYYAAVVANR